MWWQGAGLRTLFRGTRPCLGRGAWMARAEAIGPLPDARLETVFLWTRDFDRMRPFYRDILGLPVTFENPHFAAFAAGRCERALHEERQPPARRDSWHMEFLVDDIESVADGLAHRRGSVSPDRGRP